MMTFLCCVFSIMVLAVVHGYSTACMSKSLIMTEITTKDFAIQVIRMMKKLQTEDPRLSKTLVATMVYSNKRSTEFLVPWNYNLTQIEELVTTFKPTPPSRPPYTIPLTSTAFAASTTTTTTTATANSTSPSPPPPPPRGLNHDDDHQHHYDARDPLMTQVNLGLKFFRRNETGMILVLTSSNTDTNLTGTLLQKKQIPVAIGYASGNPYFAQRDSEPLLKFVDISEEPTVKHLSIARFLLYSHCTSPELLQLRSDGGIETLTTTLASNATAFGVDTSRKSTAITAGSVAAASAGVAAISVFAGRLLHGSRSDIGDDDDDDDHHHHHHRQEISADDHILETPVPREQSSLDIDSHSPPELRRSPESPVQHISFTMF